MNGANGANPIDINAAIGAWVHYNRAMLRFFLRNRDRCALVNTEALSLVSPSSRLLSFLPADLGERLPDVVQAASVDATDPVIRKLAPELLASMPEAEALYQELVASADIATPHTARDLVTVQSVLEQYFSVKVKLVEADARASESQLLISALQEQVDEQHDTMLQKTRLQATMQHANQQLETQVLQYRSQVAQLLDDVKKARGEAVEGAETKEENALLLLQLHQVQEELETYFLRETQAQQLRSEAQARASEGALQLSALQKQLEEQRKQVQEKVRQHQAAQEASAKLEKEAQQLRAQATQLQNDGKKDREEAAAGRESKEENELLLLQLHQVQEELETYFLKYQELANKQAGDGTTATTSAQGPVSNVKPANTVEVDLRGQINGDNWYYAEADGRWAGPHNKSVLRFPAPAPGRYQLVLGVVDAMAPDILSDMKISFNGQPMPHKGPREWTFMHKLLRKKRYPVTVEATVDVVEQAPNSSVTIALEFPRVISPASRGSDDQRQLAARVQYLRLVMLAPKQ